MPTGAMEMPLRLFITLILRAERVLQKTRLYLGLHFRPHAWNAMKNRASFENSPGKR